MRDVYIKDPASEIDLELNKCFQLLKPLYCLCDAGDLWFQTFDNQHRKDLSIEPLRSDPALYSSLVNGHLKGLSGTYVDNMLRVGDSDFKARVAKTSQRFEMAEDE